jgi:hypothetical protein
MSPHPFTVHHSSGDGSGGWNAKGASFIELHCTCGLSFEGEIRSAAQVFTSAWWRIHCGPGHGPSTVHVDKPTEAEILLAYKRDVENGGDV